MSNRPGPERLGKAFADLIERIPAEDLPKVGRTDATIVVTIDFDTLTGRLHQAGVLDTGERISASQARRLACTAIIPVVLGGDSEILDLGRGSRFFTKAQETAMGIRDKECLAQGCDWPGLDVPRPPLEAMGRRRIHRPRQRRTPLPRHHARAHDPTYEMTRHPNGEVSFHRRT